MYFKIAAISTLLIFSVFGQQSGSYKSPKGNGNGKGAVKAYNKSPCFEEDVYACQAEGGRFNWSHCYCERW
ncbi:MAG TPA: hypothetical protein VF527_18895 [Pyrinomonadaceae bacterium]